MATTVFHWDDFMNEVYTNGRVYMTGDFPPAWNGPFIQCPEELGVSRYEEFKADAPHVHTSNREFNYIIEGEVKILDLNTYEEYHMYAGDIFVFDPDTPYANKNQAGTTVLFWKVPGGNDKVDVEVAPEVNAWRSAWDATL